MVSETNLNYFLCTVKVLIVHQHFKTPYSGGAIRSYYLGRTLVENGFQPVVITAHNKPDYEVANIDGMEVHYLPVAYDNAFGFLKRSLSFLQFVWKAVALAGKFQDAKLCYAISVPLTVGLIARYLKWKHRIPYVFEVGDLWPDAPFEMGFIHNRFLVKQLFRLERKIYQDARSIVALSPAIAARISDKVEGKEIHLIPNMADTDFFKRAPKDPETETEFRLNGKFVVSYIGAIGLANGLENFIAFAHAAQQAFVQIHFLLCGEGAMLQEIRSQVKSLNLKNFTIVPFQNRDGVRKVLNITDAIFISYKPVPILETGSPNKYFDGLAAGKMVIVNFGGWIREEIEARQCGIYVRADRPKDFGGQMQPFLQDQNMLQRYQQNARMLAEEKYSRQILSEKFVKIIRASAMR